MMDAYKNGIPSNGQPFPDGSKIAKIEWTSKRNAVSPYFVMVPDTLNSFRSSKRIPSDFRTPTDGHTLSLAMMPRRTRLRRMGMTPSAGTSAIPRCRQKITSSRRTRRGERAAVVQRRKCNDDAHQDACRSRGWRGAHHEPLRPEREDTVVAIENEPAPKLVVDPPLMGPLTHGAVLIPYRVENLRILPVLGASALNVSPRVGHLHVTVDDLPWQGL
jgi:uncharacterized protein DUF6130